MQLIKKEKNNRTDGETRERKTFKASSPREMGSISQRLFGRDDIIQNILIKIYRNTDTNIDVITDMHTGVTYETDKPLVQKIFEF